MKKINRRSFLKAMGVASVAGVLAACGETTSTETGGDTSAATGTDTSTADGEQIEIRFLSWQTAHEEQDQKVVDAYQEKNPNVKITIEYFGDQNSQEYLKKADLMQLGGEKIDVLMTPGMADFSQRASSGAYYPMDEFFAAEGVAPTEAYEFAPVINDATYGIPADWKSWFVLINKDYLDAAGLDMPALDWTWDDYAEYAKAMTQGEGDSKIYGSYFHSWDTYTLMGLWSTYDDNPVFKADGSANFDDPQYQTWLEFRSQLVADGSQTPYTDVKAMNMNYRNEFFTGNVAMLPTGSWMITEVDDVDKFPHDFVTAFAPMPIWNGGKTGSTLVESHFYSISAGSENPQATYDFIRFFTTEGMLIKDTTISAEKGVNRMDYVTKLMSDTSLYDVESLEAVLTNPDWTNVVYTNVPSYTKTVYDTMVEVTDPYLLGEETDAAAVLVELQDRATQVIAENQ